MVTISSVFRGQQQRGDAPVSFGYDPKPLPGQSARGEDPEAIPHSDFVLTGILLRHVSLISRPVALEQRGQEVLARASDQVYGTRRGHDAA